jgi:hypothetical protein
MTGVPPGDIKTCNIGKDSENPNKIEVNDKGKAINISIFAIEETKSIKFDALYVAEEKRVVFIRTIQPDGFMFMRGEATKKDGSSQYFTVLYKRG